MITNNDLLNNKFKLSEEEQKQLRLIIRAEQGNVNKAAKLTGMNRTTITRIANSGKGTQENLDKIRELLLANANVLPAA
jgi:DNA invertase Pin-like site-specific DNA recombinase